MIVIVLVFLIHFSCRIRVESSRRCSFIIFHLRFFKNINISNVTCYFHFFFIKCHDAFAYLTPSSRRSTCPHHNNEECSTKCIEVPVFRFDKCKLKSNKFFLNKRFHVESINFGDSHHGHRKKCFVDYQLPVKISTVRQSIRSGQTSSF